MKIFIFTVSSIDGLFYLDSAWNTQWLHIEVLYVRLNQEKSILNKIILLWSCLYQYWLGFTNDFECSKIYARIFTLNVAVYTQSTSLFLFRTRQKWEEIAKYRNEDAKYCSKISIRKVHINCEESVSWVQNVFACITENDLLIFDLLTFDLLTFDLLTFFLFTLDFLTLLHLVHLVNTKKNPLISDSGDV